MKLSTFYSQIIFNTYNKNLIFNLKLKKYKVLIEIRTFNIYSYS